MSDCLFCNIIAGKVPSSKVYEDEHTYAFLDINPTNVGHTLVVPKEHSENIFDISEKSLAHVANTVRKLAPAIKEAVSADAIGILQNNGPAAGQIIFHTHIHVVPRFENDGFRHWKGARSYEDGEIEQIAESIRTQL